MRRHELDLVSLVAGVLFTGAAAAFLVGELTDVRVDPAWVVPVVLVGLGLAGLAGVLLGRARDDDARRDSD